MGCRSASGSGRGDAARAEPADGMAILWLRLGNEPSRAVAQLG